MLFRPSQFCRPLGLLLWFPCFWTTAWPRHPWIWRQRIPKWTPIPIWIATLLGCLTVAIDVGLALGVSLGLLYSSWRLPSRSWSPWLGSKAATHTETCKCMIWRCRPAISNSLCWNFPWTMLEAWGLLSQCDARVPRIIISGTFCVGLSGGGGGGGGGVCDPLVRCGGWSRNMVGQSNVK
jgi:hypothetical protein